MLFEYCCYLYICFMGSLRPFILNVIKLNSNSNGSLRVGCMYVEWKVILFLVVRIVFSGLLVSGGWFLLCSFFEFCL